MALIRRPQMKDVDTIKYFDSHMPEYSCNRLCYTVDIINRYADKNSSLVDIGCGTGNTLAFLKEQTGLHNLCAIDVSKKCLEKAQERVGCETALKSILDPDFINDIVRGFDFAVMAAVLHHLIGSSRSESRKLAAQALVNSLSLLKGGGMLIIIEPAFYPSIMMDAVFWIKKLAAMFTSKRVPIGGYWNNIGAPVVSYYTTEQIQEMIRASSGAKIIESETVPRKLSWIYTAAMIRRCETTHVVLKG